MDYFRLYREEIEKIKKDGKRPSLLLHVCCAPCSCHILTYLSDVFDITIYYSNSNIYPQSEFEKRLQVLKDYLPVLDRDIKLVVDDYDSEDYLSNMKGVLDLPEFSERCFTCYRYRLNRTFRYAKEHGFDYCTTVMSVSRYKNSEVINQTGEQLEAEYGVRFLHADFKKEKGEEMANRLAKDLNMYRQSYCGCQKSLKEHEERLRK